MDPKRKEHLREASAQEELDQPRNWGKGLELLPAWTRGQTDAGEVLCRRTGEPVLGGRGLPFKSMTNPKPGMLRGRDTPKQHFLCRCQEQSEKPEGSCSPKPPTTSPVHAQPISYLPESVCTLPFPPRFLPAHGDPGRPECCLGQTVCARAWRQQARGQSAGPSASP